MSQTKYSKKEIYQIMKNDFFLFQRLAKRGKECYLKALGGSKAEEASLKLYLNNNSKKQYTLNFLEKNFAELYDLQPDEIDYNI